MNIIRRLEDFPQPDLQTAVAIGNFDGVHLGHRKILDFLDEEARENNLISLVLTFWPHPGKITNKGQIRLIQTLEQRLEKIGQFRVHTVLILPFTEDLANLPARDFISRIVILTLKAKIIIVGENFRFGRNRSGSIQTLHSLAEKNDFSVHSIPSVYRENTMISSSIIRQHIQEGHVQKVIDFLGEPFEVEGWVIKGKSRGSNLGFPTANITTENEIIPPGVFVTRALIDGGQHPSLTNVGTSPTFGQEESNIETHIINFQANLYGKKIKIQFLDKIRDEIKFDTPEKLTAQIHRDLEHTKTYFNTSKLE